MSLLAEGLSQSKISDRLGVSRQYVNQLVKRAGTPAGPRHGTHAGAAVCACAACALFKQRLDTAMPALATHLRAGEPIQRVAELARVPLKRYIAAGRKALEDGSPTVLGDLVKICRETAHLRPRGRPPRVRATAD